MNSKRSLSLRKIPQCAQKSETRVIFIFWDFMDIFDVTLKSVTARNRLKMYVLQKLPQRQCVNKLTDRQWFGIIFGKEIQHEQLKWIKSFSFISAKVILQHVKWIMDQTKLMELGSGPRIMRYLTVKMIREENQKEETHFKCRKYLEGWRTWKHPWSLAVAGVGQQRSLR